MESKAKSKSKRTAVSRSLHGVVRRRFLPVESLGNWLVHDTKAERIMALCVREMDARYLTEVLNSATSTPPNVELSHRHESE